MFFYLRKYQFNKINFYFKRCSLIGNTVEGEKLDNGTYTGQSNKNLNNFYF